MNLAQKDHDERDLQPDKAADFPEDKFDPRPPWRRNTVANGFHASLNCSLKPGEQFGFLVKSPCDKYPRQNDRNNSKRVNFGVMLEA